LFELIHRDGILTGDWSMDRLEFTLRRLVPSALIAVVVLSCLSCAAAPASTAEPVNVALRKPATCSSIENDEHAAAAANDGDSDTCWRADDEPDGTPDWWQVDLQSALHLSGCQIRWPYDGMKYQYKVEGSSDGKTWSLLSDQMHSASTKQVHDIAFKDARQIRYLRITVTGFTEGCWPSISEVKVFGSP
jgi:alpha-L-fucosidase